jgi:hypothetical protein
MLSDQTWQRIAIGGLVVLTILMTSRVGMTGGMVSTKAANGYYASCADARAAGVTPIMRDEPGYRRELDRDNDGVACETWSGSAG